MNRNTLINMNAIIIDDTPAAVSNLADKLQKYPETHVVATAATGKEGLALVRKHKPELLFLDIELPDMTGIELLESLNDVSDHYCHVVIYTAYNDYMLPAFRNKAYDFLLKPIDDGELETVMRRFQNEATDTRRLPQHADMPHPSDGKLLFYTNSVDFRLVHIRDICLFSYDHDVRVWTVVCAGCDKPLRLKRNVTKESLLSVDSRFIQVSQRHIINMNYLLEVRDNVCRFYPPFDDIETVKVGRFFRRKLINSFNSF